jgi:hypothetical protein
MKKLSEINEKVKKWDRITKIKVFIASVCMLIALITLVIAIIYKM